MSDIREIKEGRQTQGVEEEVSYTLTVPTSWGTPTGTPTVKTYSYVSGSYTDVTSTVMPVGSGNIAAPTVTLPELKLLTEGVSYRVEVKFNTTEGDVKEAYAWIDCKR